MSKMFRWSDALLVTVMIGATATTYKLKHDAEDRLAHIRKLEADIRLEQDTIELLKADWALLTQPARLQKLSDTFAAQLALQPVEPRQFVGFEALPDKPLQSIEEVMAAADARTITGSIPPSGGER